ncbi:hypothetical protein [Micromonospora arborensis]|uniref:hypothetical protein n=1 Tax=Micromonospora arborensis TaxID=2116518 RepID=UPI0037149DA7
MDHSQVALLLGLASTRDYRKIGETDVMAWHQDLGDLDFDDASLAVSLHYRESTDRIMPAHVRRLVRQIRAERRRVETHSEPLALRGRWEVDEDRDVRMKRGMSKVSPVMEKIRERLMRRDRVNPDEPSRSELLRERALVRARSESGFSGPQDV